MELHSVVLIMLMLFARQILDMSRSIELYLGAGNNPMDWDDQGMSSDSSDAWNEAIGRPAEGTNVFRNWNMTSGTRANHTMVYFATDQKRVHKPTLYNRTNPHAQARRRSTAPLPPPQPANPHTPRTRKRP